MKGHSGESSRWRMGQILVSLIVATSLVVVAQSVTVSTAGGELRVHAPTYDFITGAVMDRLRDGRSVQLEFVLTASERAGGRALSETRQIFNLSFDLWEERVAVTRVGTPPRSVSHLRPRDAQAWCLENLTLPTTDLARRGREAPFWIKLDYRVQDDTSVLEAGDDSAFTLRRLIDVFSQRRPDGQLGKSLEAGPFRLSQ